MFFAILIFIILVYLIYVCCGYNFFEIASDSMTPTLKIGDIIAVKNDEISIGDIITFKDNIFGSITHRVVDIVDYDGQTYYLCIGDNNLQSLGFSSWQEATTYLQSLSFAEATNIVDNVVEQFNIIGKIDFKLNMVCNLIKFLFNYKIYIFLILLLLYCYYNYLNNLNKKTYF